MLTIDALRSGDLRETVRLHEDHLDLGLFPKLGPHFLRLYQEMFARSPYGVALVAHEDGGVAGALFGTTANAAHYDWVIRNHWRTLCFHGALALATRPGVALFFARTRLVRYARGISRRVAAKSPASRQTAPVAVLSHIVTSETYRGRGVARRLVDGFRRVANSHGAHEASLVTREGGLGQGFFDHIGCTCVAHRQGADNEAVCEYHLALDAPHLNGWTDALAAGRPDRSWTHDNGERSVGNRQLDPALH